jgi:sorting nexin-5/6/32
MVRAGAALTSALRLVGEASGKLAVSSKKLAAKEDLKLTDLLRYYVSDAGAARDLLCRRFKVHSPYHS